MSQHINLKRRALLEMAGCSMASFATLPLASAAAAAAPHSLLRTKRLILFTLEGGNDGLNTVIPVTDPRYRALRPTVNIARRDALTIQRDVGLHPRLKQLASIFEQGELAIVQAVGYPESSLSHFEAADIWSDAEPKRALRKGGWFTQLMGANQALYDAGNFDAAAISFSQRNGFASGSPVLVASQSTFEQPVNATDPYARTVAPGSPERLVAMLREGDVIAERVSARMARVPRLQWDGHREQLDVDVRLTNWMLEHGINAPLVRLTQGGYDTHAGQLIAHDTLLGKLDAAISTLRSRLKASGQWNDTLIMVQSEFGRRAAQNGFSGTDHGTAGPVLLIGGRVNGRVYGQPARLDQLDIDGNVAHRIDFRSLYATIADGLWQLPVNPFARAGFKPLEIVLV